MVNRLSKKRSIINYKVETDKWQSIGYPSLKFRMYSAFFDERREVTGK